MHRAHGQRAHRIGDTLPFLLVVSTTAAFTAGCQSGHGIEPRENPDLPGAAGTLVETGAMHSARAAHTATSLPDGRILVAGGMSGDERSVAGAELYDPDSGTFGVAAPMNMPRQSHSATRLLDGRVLIAGGYDASGAVVANAEIYTPNTGEFTPAGSMTGARAGHVAVLLADGRVLLAGGVGPGWTFLASAELFDPTALSFTLTGSLLEARESHTGTRLSDGRVLVVGGHRGRHAGITIFASAELYDPASGLFTATGSMTIVRHKHDAILLRDGRLLVTGGADARDDQGAYASAEMYDPASGSFSLAARMHVTRYKHASTSVALPNGRVLIAGGATQAEVYDPSAGAFALVGGDARMPGSFSASAPLADGRALITGGYGQGHGPRASVWIYSP